jgi:hypothetical protein
VILHTSDRLDILELVSKADAAASDRDTEAYVALFTDEVVLDGGMGRHAGREALRAAVGPIWEAEGLATAHLTLNAIIHPRDKDSSRANVTSVLVIVRVSPFPFIHSVSQISQDVVKLNGSWRIERRSIQLTAP